MDDGEDRRQTGERESPGPRGSEGVRGLWVTVELTRPPQAKLLTPPYPRKVTLVKRRGSWGRR